MKLIDIVRANIQEMGGEGLCNDDCGCTLEDFMPCGNPCPECVVAKKVILTTQDAELGYYGLSVGDIFMRPLKKAESKS